MNTELHDIAVKIKDLALNWAQTRRQSPSANPHPISSAKETDSSKNASNPNLKGSRSVCWLTTDTRFTPQQKAEIEALRPFIKQAVDATRYLEEDTHRRLPQLEDMGSGDPEQLDAFDHSLKSTTPESRRQALNELEALGLKAAEEVPLNHSLHMCGTAKAAAAASLQWLYCRLVSNLFWSRCQHFTL